MSEHLEIVPRNGRFFVFDRSRLVADFKTRAEAEAFVNRSISATL